MKNTDARFKISSRDSFFPLFVSDVSVLTKLLRSRIAYGYILKYPESTFTNYRITSIRINLEQGLSSSNL